MLGILFGCSTNETPLYSADCNGQLLQLSVKEKPHFDISRFWIEIKVGKLPAITITPEQVFDQSPYSFDILNNFPHQLYDTTLHSTAFGEITTEKNRFIIFIDPTKYTREEYDQINSCLSQHYAAMEKALYEKFINVTNVAHFNHPQFAGIVFANVGDLKIWYSGSDKKSKLSIGLNGEVNYTASDGHRKVCGWYKGEKPPPDSIAALYNPGEDWVQFKNTNSGRLVADDYDIYKNKTTGVVYWIRKPAK